jgi:hypothetical protein
VWSPLGADQNSGFHDKFITDSVTVRVLLRQTYVRQQFGPSGEFEFWWFSNAHPSSAVKTITESAAKK